MKAAKARNRREAISNGSVFGRLLKDWRGRRGLSQLALAVAARTTQRHLSFIESGRAAPSRDMVLRLGATLSLPLRQQNALLLAAGYAPAWKARDLSTPDLAAVNSALDYMLTQHEPYPAFVIDRCWNLLRANRGAVNLTEFLTGGAPQAPKPRLSQSISPSHYWLRTACVRLSSTGKRSRPTSSAAYRPMLLPMGCPKRLIC
jgi:transcriptional regulator with XRE-family HTH domain